MRCVHVPVDDLASRYDPAAFARRADALFAGRRIEEALALYRRAVAAGHAFENCAQALWMGAMLLGCFDDALSVSDRILQQRAAAAPCWHLPRHEQWVWDGRPLAGKRVLVRCYHGLGDTLQFVRFVPRLRQIAAEVTLWAQPALLPILEGSDDFGRLMPLHDGTPEVDYDADIELMELAHALRIGPAALGGVPYLTAEPRPLPRDRFNIGLVWAAGDWDPRRGLPLPLLAPLADIPGVTLWSLQRGAALADLRAPGAPPTRNPDEASEDVIATASLIRGLDLVITVDTMVAHLAGALGAPAWTLLQFAADWRWQLEGDATPWYPTMRLFRQSRPGDWAEVARRVVDAVRSQTAVPLPRQAG